VRDDADGSAPFDRPLLSRRSRLTLAPPGGRCGASCCTALRMAGSDSFLKVGELVGSGSGPKTLGESMSSAAVRFRRLRRLAGGVAPSWPGSCSSAAVQTAILLNEHPRAEPVCCSTTTDQR
jgi:hypothetical protein